MLDLLKRLCLIDGTSGDEAAVRQFVINEIKDFCEYRVDNLGNIICFKKGKNRSRKKIMIDAHMDEVGLIITSVTEDGFLKFSTVGGIDTAAMMFRRVKINGEINGVISGKPFHLLDTESRKKLPKSESLYIDIGTLTRAEALEKISLGDRAVMMGEFEILGDCVKSKALDDRIGCAVLISLLKEKSEYDFYATFTTQEEIGLRGARTAAFAVKPDVAIVLDATTAADISGTPKENQVCVQGKGVAVSFMDKATLYDKELYTAAIGSGIPCQPKSAVAGGNNAGGIHLSGNGVRTVALSAPCRYIHSAGSVVNLSDIKSMTELTAYILNGVCGGNIK